MTADYVRLSVLEAIAAAKLTLLTCVRVCVSHRFRYLSLVIMT